MTPPGGRRLRWTELAADDLEAIADHLGERAPEAAARVVREIVAACRGLTEWPHKGRRGRREGTRELVIASRPYIVVYQVREEAVVVVRVVDGRRDLERVLG